MSSGQREAGAEPASSSLHDGERRSAARFRLPLTIGIVHRPIKKSLGLARNISGSGVWIQNAEFRPPMGDRIEVNVLIPGLRQALRLCAEVVRYTGESGFAAQFLFLDSKMQKALQALLEVLAREIQEDEAPTEVVLSPELVQRLDPEVERLLELIAEREGRDAEDLLGNCRRRLR